MHAVPVEEDWPYFFPLLKPLTSGSRFSLFAGILQLFAQD